MHGYIRRHAHNQVAVAPTLQLHDGTAGWALVADDQRVLHGRRRVTAAVARRPRRAVARRWFRWLRRRRCRSWCRRLGVALTVRRGAAARRPRGLWAWIRVGVRVRYQLACGWLRLGLGLRFRFGWRRLDDLDVLDDPAGLAAKLAGEPVGVEGARHDHLVLLVHDLVDDELPPLLDAAEDLLDVAAAAAALQVYRDDQLRHL
uniref:Uncharacterized protein n=1 Tax=Arundo donax TaxID=35708 RepID=A0A0A9GNK6_ARUDO